MGKLREHTKAKAKTVLGTLPTEGVPQVIEVQVGLELTTTGITVVATTIEGTQETLVPRTTTGVKTGIAGLVRSAGAPSTEDV